MKPWLLIGIGNAFRADDAAGLEVARFLASRNPEGIVIRESAGESTSLIEQWRGADRVILVDAMDAGCEPGTVLRFDASRRTLPAVSLGGASTHAVGPGEAIELARSLDLLPSTLIVFGIQAESFETGAGMSPAVMSAVPETADRILAEARNGPTDAKGNAFPTHQPQP